MKAQRLWKRDNQEIFKAGNTFKLVLAPNTVSSMYALFFIALITMYTYAVIDTGQIAIIFFLIVPSSVALFYKLKTTTVTFDLDNFKILKTKETFSIVFEKKEMEMLSIELTMTETHFAGRTDYRYELLSEDIDVIIRLKKGDKPMELIEAFNKHCHPLMINIVQQKNMA